MLRSAMTSCLWAVLSLFASGCMTCGCGPVMPFDSAYPGCVGTGFLGQPQSARDERREMRRALRHSCNNGACPTCSSGMGDCIDYGGGIMNGMPQGMQTGMISGATCPTCQQHMPISPQYSDQMQFQPMNAPVPTPMPSQPHLSTPTPTPAPVPGATPPANSSTHYYPAEASPVGGQYYTPPPQVQAFNNYSPQPSPPPLQQTLYAP